MPLSEQLSNCLFNLTTHCEGLLAQIESLRAENESLRNRLEAASRRPADGQKDSGFVLSYSTTAVNHMVVSPPGLVPEEGSGWSSLVPQPRSQAPSAEAEQLQQKKRHQDRIITEAPSPAERQILQQQQRQLQQRRQPRAPLGSKHSSDSVQTVCVEEESSCGFAPRTITPYSGGKGDESLAAARLGMLMRHAVEAPHSNDALMDTISVVAHEFRHDFDILQTEGRQGHIIAALVESFVFKTICMLAIAANTIYIGLEADFKVKNSYRRLQGIPKEPDWMEADIIFTAWFGLELLLRIIVQRRQFFVGEEWKWNGFDCFLVANSLLELIFPAASGNFSFLRIFRVFRVVRIVKVVRTLKALRSLRTMVFALLNSFVCLLWAFVMIVLIMFVFGIIFSNGVAGYFDDIDINSTSERIDAEQVNKYFGNLYETMVSLLSSITGGSDWMVYGESLRLLNMGEAYFAMFYFYIVFSVVGMLNVVTGIFVDSAVCTRTEDEVVECFTEDQKRTSEEVRRIFKEADKDESGTLSFEELARHLENPWVKAYFAGLDIDPSEAGIIFALIDTDGSNSVTIDEFVDGTMKLKGHAKSIDVLSMMFDTVRFSTKFNHLCSYIEEEMWEIKKVITPDAAAIQRKPVFQTLESPVPLAARAKLSRMR